mmetsp:Transcript_7247/g.20430  ORF Transcript_7247/g.20430 Transcript_7247/m.20430 type:complete len:265 (+) Transcript_7247:313-1107(+)
MSASANPSGDDLMKPAGRQVEEVSSLQLSCQVPASQRRRHRRGPPAAGTSPGVGGERAGAAEAVGGAAGGLASVVLRTGPGHLRIQGHLQHGLLVLAVIAAGLLPTPGARQRGGCAVVAEAGRVADEAVRMQVRASASLCACRLQEVQAAGAEEAELFLAPQQHVDVVVEVVVQAGGGPVSRSAEPQVVLHWRELAHELRPQAPGTPEKTQHVRRRQGRGTALLVLRKRLRCQVAKLASGFQLGAELRERRAPARCGVLLTKGG